MAADILGQIASARSLERDRPLPPSIMLELKECAIGGHSLLGSWFSEEKLVLATIGDAAWAGLASMFCYYGSACLDVDDG